MITKFLSNKNQKGFIGTIVLIIIALILLQYVFGFNIIDYIKSPKTIAVLDSIKDFLQTLWK